MAEMVAPATGIDRVIQRVITRFDARAEFIRELIVEGTREGLAAARGRGVRFGRPPALTAEQIRHARDLLTRPDNTVSSIARLLGVSRATIYKYFPELPPRPGLLRPSPGRQWELRGSDVAGRLWLGGRRARRGADGHLYGVAACGVQVHVGIAAGVGPVAVRCPVAGGGGDRPVRLVGVHVDVVVAVAGVVGSAGGAPGPAPPAPLPRPRFFSAVSQSAAMASCAAVRLTRPSQTAAFRASSTLSFGFGVGGYSGHKLVASLLPPSSSGTRWSSSVRSDWGVP